MTPEELLKLDGVIAQLRHAYRNVLNTHFDTTILRKSFADGLIAPQIRALEALSAQLAAQDASKDGVYAERDRLVCAISKVWPSHLARHPDSDTSWEDEWRWIVCVHSPQGQLTWHIHDRERHWFDHLSVEDGHWDGHSTDEKYARLGLIEAQDVARGEIVKCEIWLPGYPSKQCGSSATVCCIDSDGREFLACERCADATRRRDYQRLLAPPRQPAQIGEPE